MDSLPFDLLEEILFKLDRKSLAMMQCTEKSINSHISDDPYFKSRFRLMDHSDESKLLPEIVCGSKTESNLSSEIVRETKEEVCLDVHGYDLGGTKSGVMGSIPGRCDSSQFKPSFSSAMEVDEKVDVMTMVGHDKLVSSLSMKIMRLINEVSPYAQNLLKKKGTQLGKIVLIEEEVKKVKRKVRSGSKFVNTERINKRIRVM